MASLRCPCGNRLSNVCCPNDLEGVIFNYWSAKWDNMEQYFEADNGRDVWECKECGRLGFDFPDGNNIKWYVPENGKSGDLL